VGHRRGIRCPPPCDPGPPWRARPAGMGTRERGLRPACGPSVGTTWRKSRRSWQAWSCSHSPGSGSWSGRILIRAEVAPRCLLPPRRTRTAYRPAAFEPLAAVVRGRGAYSGARPGRPPFVKSVAAANAHRQPRCLGSAQSAMSGELHPNRAEHIRKLRPRTGRVAWSGLPAPLGRGR
jgi:hypothetical protein